MKSQTSLNSLERKIGKPLAVFVDESGDLGFSKAATKYFVVAYTECNAPIRIQTDLKRPLKHLHQKKIYSRSRNMLKFSRMDD